MLRKLIYWLQPVLPAPDRSTARNWHYYVREWRAEELKR